MTEKENLTIKIEKLETTSNATDNLRTKLNADKESLLASTKKLKSVIPNLEIQVKSLLGKLPNALLEEINNLDEKKDEADEDMQESYVEESEAINEVDPLKVAAGITG